MRVVNTRFGEFVLSKAVPSILGLAFSYQLIQNAFLSILITHLTDEWKHEELRKAVVVVSIQEGTSATLQIIFVICADAYTGNFVMVALSSIVSEAGLILTFVSALKVGHLQLKVFYPALLLMALSQAAKQVTLKAFLHDQLVPRDREASEDEVERAKKNVNLCMKCASSLAVPAALADAYRVDSLRALSFILACVMGASLICFLLSFNFGFYNCPKPTGSALRDVVPVFRRAVKKRNVAGNPNIQIPHDVSCLRWMDRAAEEEHENQTLNTTAYSVEQVKGVKFLFKMIPMWGTFILFCLVYSSGRTFFLQEAKSVTGDNLPILLFLIIPKFVEFAVSRICVFILKKLGYNLKENTAQQIKLGRIGLGMLCSVLCCICAWINALHRLHPFPNHPKLHDYLSLYRLLPQFLFLALMERLSIGGLEQFFDSQVSKSISRYGPPFGECVIGVGNFFSVIFILILSRRHRWFQDTVALSHLHKYYRLLTGFSSINFLIYCCVAHWYGEDKFLSEEDDNVDGDIEMGTIISEALDSRAQLEEGSSGDDRTENMMSITQHETRGQLPRVNSFPRASSPGIRQRPIPFKHTISFPYQGKHIYIG